MLVEESSVKVRIAWIFFLYLLVKEIDQILIFLAVVFLGRRLSLLSLAVSLLYLRRLLFVVIYWISSGLSTVIVTCSWIVLSLHCRLAVTTEIWSVKLLLNRVLYWTLQIFFLVLMIYPLSTSIRILFQVARIV